MRWIINLYRKYKQLNRLLETNIQLEVTLKAKEKTLTEKTFSLESLRIALEDQKEILKRRNFDCDIREVLIEAREAASS